MQRNTGRTRLIEAFNTIGSCIFMSKSRKGSLTKLDYYNYHSFFTKSSTKTLVSTNTKSVQSTFMSLGHRSLLSFSFLFKFINMVQHKECIKTRSYIYLCDICKRSDFRNLLRVLKVSRNQAKP